MNTLSAHIISALFNPVVNPLIAFSLLAWTDRQLDFAEKIEFAGIAALFASGLIILCLFIFIRLGLIHSLDIPARQQRSLPLVAAAIVLFTGFLTLSFARAPHLMQGLMWCYATETLVVAIISRWWKISIHTASIACSLVALTNRFGAIAFAGYFLLLLVGEARIVLKKHTLAQIVTGALLGAVLTAIQLLYFKSA